MEGPNPPEGVNSSRWDFGVTQSQATSTDCVACHRSEEYCPRSREPSEAGNTEAMLSGSRAGRRPAPSLLSLSSLPGPGHMQTSAGARGSHDLASAPWKGRQGGRGGCFIAGECHHVPIMEGEAATAWHHEGLQR